ncbi:MAG: phosphoribosyl-ATP diphosphatase [Oscillatoriales cyanobacterium SM2_1_8]|nr:phosphoribosyl-ATP diphosphatase [Oscillatoriales cyanobacterium SM2_1_8]
MQSLFAVIRDRQQHPQPDSYTSKLLAGGDNRVLKKIGEETVEFVMACKDREKPAIAAEAADVLYHLLVALAHCDTDLSLVYAELAARRR